VCYKSMCTGEHSHYGRMFRGSTGTCKKLYKARLSIRKSFSSTTSTQLSYPLLLHTHTGKTDNTMTLAPQSFPFTLDANTSLGSQHRAVLSHFQGVAPQAVRDIIKKSTEDLARSFDPSSAIQVGQLLPDFSLSSATGDMVTKAQLLAKGPILISFYRGGWCPFCSLELRALQKRLPEFEAKGVTLVAISPELPNQSLSTVEKIQLQFKVLSDVGNTFARQLGIVWKQPDYLRPLFDKFDHNLVPRNGDDSFELPIPASLLVDQQGVVRNIFLDIEYKNRLEPEVALQWIDEL
jgi:peroxiredoxin